MSAPRYEDHVGLTHKLAKRAFAWAASFQASLTYEDVLQEMAIAFMQASRAFDPERGFAFSTLYSRCATTHFKKVMEKEMRGTCRYMDRDSGRIEGGGVVSVESLVAADDEGADPYEFLDLGASASPEQLLELKQEIAAGRRRLNPTAQVILEWMTNPPQELKDELGRIRAHHREQPGCVELPTIREITDFMILGGCTPGQVNTATSQLKSLANAL